MKNKKLMSYSILFILGLVLLLLPLFLDNYIIHILNQIGIFVILVSSLNLIVGFTGQLSFAHVGLFAIGAYTSAILTISGGLSFWLSLPIAALVAGIFGFLIGLPALRFQTHFFAIVTLGFAEIIRLSIYNWRDLTGGPNGIYSIPFPQNILWFDFTQRSDFYYIILVGVFLTVIFVRYLTGTRTGKAMVAIRENEIFAKFIGINTWRVKMVAFTISSIIAGFAGSIYAHYHSYISPYSFSVSESVTFLLMVIIGGMGTIVGPILGAIFLTVLPELLRSIADYRMVIYGALLVLTIMYMPKGLVGLFKDINKKFGWWDKMNSSDNVRADSSDLREGKKIVGS